MSFVVSRRIYFSKLPFLCVYSKCVQGGQAPLRLSFVDKKWGIPPLLPSAMPILPDFHLPRQRGIH